ncbi:hypothetical protein PDESU_02398 [Pontiella desulfatans]|uniref:LamG-like jellyroll fold domain-containing protein n=1 Tax=Pontiella desulfatans TaxID=2750659 RepID=A0A6C2U2P3_PONDE|nr:LamG domain-containing protein [Pontiella desulfatans]VGO13841.1 hypothetical protein PDESU_02398 [Pontiella desulfatans]
MKTTSIFLALLAGVATGQAGTIYYQDFSNSTPVSDQAGNNPITDGVQVATVVDGEVISGGSPAEQASNGEYTITIDGVGSHYIFNETGDPGFKYVNSKYAFESGSISFIDGGTSYTGTIKLYSKCNTGGEFFSINSVGLVQDDATGEVYVEIDFNYYADTETNQTDSLFLTLDFGVNDAANLQIEERIGGELGSNSTGAGVYRHGLIELLEASSIEAEAMTLDGFSIESQAGASGGQGIVLNGSAGTASGTFALSGAGVYDIQTAYFDENDGEAVYKLFLDGGLIDAWSANRGLGSADPASGNLVVHQTRKIHIAPGQTLEVLAYADGGEPCRVDGFSINQSTNAPPAHSMVWNADGTIASLLLGGVEHLSAETGKAQLRIFNGTQIVSWDMMDATGENGVVEVVEDERSVAKMYFRVDEYEHHLLFRLIGLGQVPLYDDSLGVRVAMPISGTVHAVALDENAEATVSGSLLQFDWTKLGGRNRFPGGAFALYADGTPAENEAALQEIEELYGSAPAAEDLAVFAGEEVPSVITLPSGTGYAYTHTQPTNGVLSGTAPDLVYTSNPGAASDSFTYFITYNGLVSETKTVAITIVGRGLVAYWPMDEGSGAVVGDASGHGFDGALSGGAWVDGRAAGALEFNGSTSSDAVVLPANVFGTVGSGITIAMWVKGDSAAQPRKDSVFYAEDSGGNRLLNIHLPWSDSKVYWDAGDSGGYDRVSKTASAADYEGQWNHWAFTKDANAGRMSIYLNGSLWLSDTGTVTRMGGVMAEARLGSGVGGNYYEGALDDVRVYNYALTEAEISALYFTYDGFAAWAAGYGLAGGDASTGADAENGGAGDGYDNLAEYALGMDPTNSDAGSMDWINVASEDGTNWFEYVHSRRADYTNQGLSYLLIDSTNLVDSVASTNTQDQILVGPSVGGYEPVTNRYIADDPVKFIQLKVRAGDK